MCANILPYSFLKKKSLGTLIFPLTMSPSRAQQEGVIPEESLAGIKPACSQCNFTEGFLSWILIVNNMTLGKRENTEENTGK